MPLRRAAAAARQRVTRRLISASPGSGSPDRSPFHRRLHQGGFANSCGFAGRDRDTRHSIGCALIAGQGEAMQRDGWYSAGLADDGNLKAMFRDIEAVGSDIDPRSHVGTGSILVGKMTVAGGQ